MATKAQVERKAKALGLEFSIEGSRHEWAVVLYTPKGFIFTATDCHTCINSEDTLKEALDYAWADLQYGLLPCPFDNCETCR